MTHISVQRLQELAENGLDDEEAARHLNSCQRCSKIFTVYRNATREPEYATDEQITAIRNLYRRAKLFYRGKCIDNKSLDEDVQKRYGYIINELTKQQATELIDILLREVERQSKVSIYAL